MQSLLKPEDVDLLADRDLKNNYRALELALDYKTEITVELALIATGLRGSWAASQPPVNNYKKHNFTRSDAQEMARMRKSGSTYFDIGNKFQCSPSHIYIVLRKYGLFELGKARDIDG